MDTCATTDEERALNGGWDAAIYWLIPVCAVEVTIHLRVEDDPRIQQTIDATLKTAMRRELLLTWDEHLPLRFEDRRVENTLDQCIIFRLAFAYPLFHEIKLIRASSDRTTWTLIDGTGTKELPLHPLMYRGEQALGALDGDVLYVLLPLKLSCFAGQRNHTRGSLPSTQGRVLKFSTLP